MMRVAMRKAKLYLKLVLIVAVVVLCSVVLCNNRNNRTAVWFFTDYQEVNVLKLMLVTAVVSVFSFWVLSTVIHVWKEWREISGQVAQQEREKQLQTRTRELDERERRLKEKTEESPPGT